MVRVCDVSDDGFVFCTGKHSRKSASIVSIHQQTRDMDPMLDYCWANVADVGPTLIQH